MPRWFRPWTRGIRTAQDLRRNAGVQLQFGEPPAATQRHIPRCHSPVAASISSRTRRRQARRPLPRYPLGQSQCPNSANTTSHTMPHATLSRPHCRRSRCTGRCTRRRLPTAPQLDPPVVRNRSRRPPVAHIQLPRDPAARYDDRDTPLVLPHVLSWPPHVVALAHALMVVAGAGGRAVGRTVYENGRRDDDRARVLVDARDGGDDLVPIGVLVQRRAPRGVGGGDGECVVGAAGVSVPWS